jgi:hypothetical protein
MDLKTITTQDHLERHKDETREMKLIMKVEQIVK